MTKKRKRRGPEQIVKLLQEGQAMLAAGKPEAEVFHKLEITESADIIGVFWCNPIDTPKGFRKAGVKQGFFLAKALPSFRGYMSR